MQPSGLLHYRLKYCWLKVVCCISRPNQLEPEIRHKSEGQTGGQPKIWVGHGLRNPLGIAQI